MDRCYNKRNIIKKIKNYILRDEKLGFYLIIGFLIGSPSFIFKPNLYFEHLFQFTNSTINWSFNFLYNPSVGKFWETVINPSLLWVSFSILSIVFLFVFFNKWRIENKKIFFSFLISLLVSLMLFMKASNFFPWYSYPIIVLFLVFLLNIKMPKKYFYALILLNLLSNSPVIFGQIANKAIHIYNHYNRQNIESYIESQKKEFSKNYPDFEEYISVRPETGSRIITLNGHLLGKEPFKKPTFIAVNEIMMVSYGNNQTIYHYIAELFNNNRINHFNEKIDSLDQEIYNVNFLGSYKNVHVFTVIPREKILK